jgi:hypothetical protein
VRRPKSLFLLVVVLLGFAVFNLQGLVSGLQHSVFLSRLPLSVSPLYLITSDAVWAIAFASLAIGLWLLKSWARSGALIAVPLYFAHGWFNRLVLSRSDFAHVPLGWAGVWSIVWIGLVWGILSREKVRKSFQLNK